MSWCKIGLVSLAAGTIAFVVPTASSASEPIVHCSSGKPPKKLTYKCGKNAICTTYKC